MRNLSLKLVASQEQRIGPRLIAKGCALLILGALAGCHAQDAPAPEATDAATDMATKSGGTFSCHPDAPIRPVQVSSSSDVAPGASTTLTVEAPPEVPSWLTPDKMTVYCQVDTTWCSGTSCRGNPPVDFIGTHGDGLTWQSVGSQGGQTKTTFTAVVHNSDPANPHHVTITLALPQL